MGPIINTRGAEVSPFFHHKFNVLYFSSNGQPLTFGDFDIYKVYKSNQTWNEPKNMDLSLTARVVNIILRLIPNPTIFIMHAHLKTK